MAGGGTYSLKVGGSFSVPAAVDPVMAALEAISAMLNVVQLLDG
jgi:hypothetical protein